MVLVSAGCAVTAKLIKEAGYDAIWISGFEASARLGLPDNGSITLHQMLNVARPIIRAVDIPVFVDIDTGYTNFKETIKEFEEIGVSGVCIEDVMPEYKQNSLWGDKVPLMNASKFAKKVDIDRKIAIIARSEALVRGYGADECIKRLELYREAGADYLMPHSRTLPLDVNDLKGKFVTVPTKFPEFTNMELEDMGYSMIVWANQTCRVQIRAVRDMLYTLKKHDRMLEAEEHLCATLEDMKGLTK